MNAVSILEMSHAEKVNQFIALLRDPDIKDALQALFETFMATSELKFLKRLAATEASLGLNDFADFEDEPTITIPEQLSILSKRIDEITACKEPTKESIKNPEPKTTLENKACQLVEHLKNKVVSRNGEIYLTTKETIHFLKNTIKEEYRLKDIQNPRQAKKDIIEKAKQLFYDCIFLDKKKHGNKDVRIVYKQKNNISNHQCIDSMQLKSNINSIKRMNIFQSIHTVSS
jgi:hypothetical protein